MKILWVLTAICSVVAILVTIILLSEAESAPQEAVGVAIGIAVIPYCFSRAISEFHAVTQREMEDERRMMDATRRRREDQDKREADYQRLKEEERRRLRDDG